MNNILIRQATTEDASIILELIKEFAGYLGKSDMVKVSIDDLTESKSSYGCLLIETAGQTVGYALYNYAFHTWSGKSIYVDDIYVKEAFRRQGVGRRIVNELYKIANENDCCDIRWQVLDWNKSAIAFYENIGATVGDDNLNCKLTIK